MSNTLQPKFSVVLRNRNSFELTDQCIRSLKKINYKNFIICVVDDGSSDNSVELLNQKYSDVNFIRSPKYLEYCKSLNLGIKFSLKKKAEYIFIVNNDTRNFSLNYFTEILKKFNDNNKLAIVSSKVLYFDKKIIFNSKPRNKLNVMMKIPTEGYVIKSIIFSKVGFFDEKIVRYFEDLDFIIRVNSHGFETTSLKSISFEHMTHGTSRYQPFIPNFYRSRNIIWFVKRYCKNRSILWKFKQYSIYLIGNLSRSMFFLKRFELIKFLISLFAIFWGSLIGLVTKW